MMKNLFKLSLALLLAGTVFVSCEKDEEKKELSITDVSATNHNDGSTIIARGGTIAVEFTATAGDDARLDFYHIEIHDHPASGEISDEYKIIDDDFKDDTVFKGLREASKHVHVSVPDTANLGSYHVVIVVVDENGYSVDTEELETHVTIVE
ncbi:MAG: DUF4625 domain-containing protein [Bacteroidales bacterium]|nr:DUF4625 domain-containing protein [Bacteroidales bacterium]